MIRAATWIFGGALLATVVGAAAQPQSVTLASRTPGGAVGNKASLYPSVSEQGRFVVFSSLSSNLIGLDSNNAYDIFAYDAQTGSIERISNGLNGSQPNNSSYWPTVSADGRYVAFYSLASNLVAGDTNARWDVFVFDRQLRVTERVTSNVAGGAANGDSINPVISADGRFVAYVSYATDLIANDTNNTIDVFIYDRINRATERVSVAPGGVNGNGGADWPALSADGRYVAFQSAASNLVANDGNGQTDIFVLDRSTGALVSVSHGGNGPSNWPTLSGDGKVVAFSSAASNLVPGDNNNAYDVVLVNLADGSRAVASVDTVGRPANGHSYWPRLDSRGRYVAFTTLASNLGSGDANNTWDVYVHDTRSRQSSLISSVGSGAGNNMSYWPALSADGRYVAMSSMASNFTSADSNGTWDIFLADRGPLNQPPVANAGSDVVAECAGSVTPVMLDGAASYDPDGDVMTYTWNGGFGTLGGAQVNVNVPFGDNAISLSVQDPDGEASSDGMFVRVVDTVAPSILLQDEFRAEAQSAQGAVVSVDPIVADACSAVNVVVAPTPSSFPIGETTVTVTATDVHQNSASQTSRVIVQDTIAPTIAAPAALTVEAQGPTTVVDLDPPAATDAVGVVALYHTGPDHYPLGTTLVDWYAEDAAGNQATAAQSVALVDTTPPTIAAPSDVEVLASSVLTEVALGEASANDTVDGAVPAFADNVGPFGVGSHVVEWRAADRSGNHAAATQRVTILNNVPIIQALFGASLNEGDGLGFDVAFSDPDALQWDVTIDYGDGASDSRVVAAPAQNFSIGHIYENDGDYQLTVRIRDEHGAEAVAGAVIVVANVMPNIGAVTWPADVAIQGDMVEMLAEVSDPGVRDALTWSIDWGDGHVDEGATTAGGGSIQGSHVYATPGFFTVVFSVRDGASNEARTVSSSIAVVNADEWAVVGGGRFGAVPHPRDATDEDAHKGRIGFRLVGPASAPHGQVSLYWRDAAGARWKLKARTHDWMIVTEQNIHMKGEGTLNGEDAYSYQIGIGMVDSKPATMSWRVWNTATGEMIADGAEEFRRAGFVVAKPLPDPKPKHHEGKTSGHDDDDNARHDKKASSAAVKQTPAKGRR